MCFEKHSKYSDPSLGMARTLCLQAECRSQPPCFQLVLWRASPMCTASLEKNHRHRSLLCSGIGPALGSTTRPPVPQVFAAPLVGKEPFKPGMKGGTTILGVIWYLLAISKGHPMAGGTEDSLQLLGQGKVVLSTKQHQQSHCLSSRRLH